jgi:polyhydroxyalkanoate synthesis regulator phasin
MTLKIDAKRPFYAVVGAGELAVEYARTYASDVQTRIAKVDIEPKALRDQARTVVVARVDELTKDAKQAQAKLEARVAELQADAKTLPGKVETLTNEAVVELTETYGDLAARGKDLVARIRRQQATQDAQAAVKGTVTRAKTAKTQTTKSAQATAGTAKKSASATKSAAKTTGSTAKRTTKATGTSAKKAASATGQATTDAASKVGN